MFRKSVRLSLNFGFVEILEVSLFEIGTEVEKRGDKDAERFNPLPIDDTLAVFPRLII